MVILRSGFVLAAVLGLATGCAEGVESPPPPRPSAPPPVATRPVAPPPAAPPAPLPVAGNWEDWPYTQGDWTYRSDSQGSFAFFGPVGADAVFSIQCNRGSGQIVVRRMGNFPPGDTGRMTIRATTGLQTYQIQNLSEAPPYVGAAIPASDRHLDAMAFSRGRFVVSVKGTRDLVIPSWPELTGVIEDCR